MGSRPQNLSFVLKKPLEVAFEDRPIPQIKNDRDVLVEVKYTGICGSDVHYWLHGRIGPFVVNEPMVLGHESAGIVVEVGSAVTTVKPGDKIALEPGIPCRYCRFCKSGEYNLCPNIKFAATPPYDGTLANFYVLPEDLCHVLPPEISLKEGALVEPLAVAVHVVKQRAKVKPFDSVVIFGAGPIGLLCAAVARAFGASKIIAVELTPERVTFAEKYATTGVFNLAQEQSRDDPEEIAKKIIEKYDLNFGADVAIEASGVGWPARCAIHVVRRGGTVVQVGAGVGEVELPITEITVKELNVTGSFRYGSGDYKTAVELIASGKVSVKELITDTFKFEAAEEAFKAVTVGKGIKVIIESPSKAR